MADENTQNEFSYIGKTPLLRALKNPSGQFFLFSQYAEDLTKFLGNPNSDMPIPSSFYCLKVEKPNTNTHINNTVDDGEPQIPEPTEDLIYVVYYSNDEDHKNVYWQAASKGEDYTVLDLGWTKEGYSFDSWGNTETSPTDTFSPGDIIPISASASANIELYAQWDAAIIEEEHEEDESAISDKWTPEQIATLFINPADENETLLAKFNSILCKELKYKGNINIFGKDKVDGINYNEIYCHIDNDANRQKFQLDLSDYRDWKYDKNYIIGYGPNPNDYQFTNYSDLIGEIFQNEYENGNTFFKLNNDLFDDIEEQWDEKYSLGRLLYVLYKNEMIHFALSDDANIGHLYDDEPDIDDYNSNDINNSNESSLRAIQSNSANSLSSTTMLVERAGVLSSKALFDSWYEGDGTEEDPARGEYRYFRTNDMIVTDMPEKMKFDFNCIIVCYTHKNMTTGETDVKEIPMGIYFTGWDSTLDNGEGDFSNVFTKYVKNMEIYNQGTSYTLRICARTIASQSTEQGAERIVEVISASNTGEWVNEYEQLMCKFDETNNALEQTLSKYAQMNDSIETSLQIFRNGRTNVPYIAEVNGVKYWFVNGVNTWARVFEPEDYADWTTDPIDSAFRKVDITLLTGEYYLMNPIGIQECYVGNRMSVSISPLYPYYTVEKIFYETENMGEPYQYVLASITSWEYDTYTDNQHNISISRELISEDPNTPNYRYVFTILDVQEPAMISAEAN